MPLCWKPMRRKPLSRIAVTSLLLVLGLLLLAPENTCAKEAGQGEALPDAVGWFYPSIWTMTLIRVDRSAARLLNFAANASRLS